MVFYCICGGCNNSSKSGHRVHCFPKDKGILRSWVQFVKSKRTAKLIPTAVPSVHANHSACPVPRSRDTVCRKREIATV
ncbi:unnamed protein product [Arctogadus glacialis]